MKHCWIAAALVAAPVLVFAKLPPLDDAAKAKAAEAAAKAGWQAKVDTYQVCKAQDRVAAVYMKSARAAGKDPKPAQPVTPAPGAAAAAAAPVAAAAGTPVAPTPPTACSDPGPFAYNAPSQTPLETSGAHSPAGNAVSPPSVKQESATMAPAKKSP
jgi:hypothetical protein